LFERKGRKTKHGLVLSSGAAVWLLAQQNCTFPETKVALVGSSDFRCARIPERSRSKVTFVQSVQFCCVKTSSRVLLGTVAANGC